MLFINYSSTFNIIVLSKLIIKLEALGLNPALDVMTGCPQVVKVGNNISTSLTLTIGASEGCVLSPLLYSLFTHDCVAMHASNIIKSQIKSNQILFVTYTWLADVNASVAKCLCF